MNKRFLIAAVLTVVPRELLAQGQVPPEILVAENMWMELSKAVFPYTLLEQDLLRKIDQERLKTNDLATLMSLCWEDIQKVDETCVKAGEVKRKFQRVIQHYPAGERRDAVTQFFCDGYDRVMERRVGARVRLMMTFIGHRWAWEKGDLHIKGRLFTLLQDLCDPEYHSNFPHLRKLAGLEMALEDLARPIIGR